MSAESFINRVATRDTVVYWGSPTVAGDGTVSFIAPIEIGCIWREDLRLIKDFFEKEVASRAHAYVTIDLEERGMLFHGKLSDLSDAEQTTPSTIPNAYEIRRFMKVPSLSIKTKFMRKAYV